MTTTSSTSSSSRLLAPSKPLLLLCTVALAAIIPHIAAQSTLDTAHIEMGKNVGESDKTNGSAALKVDVNLVLVPTTVTDDMNRVVVGLDKENFQIYENNRLQPVQHFASTDVPVSLGIIFDSSGSMEDKIDRARDAVSEFVQTANPEDEFFLVTFANSPSISVGFTTAPDDITNNLVFGQPRGKTALLDAIYLGVTAMHNAKYSKKALLIISDGGDNHSRYTEKDVKRIVRESDVMIYSIGIYDRHAGTLEEQLGPELLGDVSQVSGGRSFAIDNPNDLTDIASKIAVELRNQYVLGYRPGSDTADGKYHKIKVKLLPPKGFPHLNVSAKPGYYAREN